LREPILQIHYFFGSAKVLCNAPPFWKRLPATQALIRSLRRFVILQRKALENTAPTHHHLLLPTRQ